MAEVVLYHHVQGLTAGLRWFRRRAAAGGPHGAHARPVRGAHLRHDRGGHGLRARGGLRRTRRARSGRRPGDPPRRRLRRLLVRGHGRPATRADAARRPGGAAHVRAASRSRSSGRRGPWAFRCRYMARTATRSSPKTSRPRGSSSSRPTCAELFLYYPGVEHLFADSSLPAYDAAAAALLSERVLAFLDADQGSGLS